MSQELERIRSELVAAIRAARAALATETKSEGDLFGFALCTDNALRTLYHVGCSNAWVKRQETSYPDIGYIPTEWGLDSNKDQFNRIGDKLSALADIRHASNDEWSTHRNHRFEMLVLALQESREADDFSSDALLCACSTDPSEELRRLAMDAVDRLNASQVADRYATANGFQ